MRQSRRWPTGLLVLGLIGLVPAFGNVARAEAPFLFATAPGKLPKTVVPTHYAVSLQPDLKTLAMPGVEVVNIDVLRPTSRLVLNALNMAIGSASLDGETGQVADVSIDPKGQTATLTFPNSLEAGPHKLRIAFTAHINGFGSGMFFADYQAGNGTKRMVGTQFEPTDARRVFPCWDEPSFKAIIEPAIVVPNNFLAVSNMPITREEPVGPQLKRVSFGATPRMSTYLFVLVAGELERITRDAGGVTVGVVTTSGKGEQGRYALDSAAELLGYYNRYFGIKFPLPKLDLIAIPGGFGGAMENWGGITFYEGILLYDPASSPKSLQRRIFAVLAHEMAHQWFGDLVTTAWWSDLWLNEGFANWMQAKVESNLHPDWEVWLNQSGEKQAAMYADARTMTHPIEHPVADESEAAIAFDEITYDKGAAIIRLIENYLGEESFRDGIRRYMKEHAYSNATTADLWSALEQASGKPVASIAKPYTEQPGLPLITVNEQCRGDQRHLLLKQERFTIHDPDAHPERWQVPIAWITAGARKSGGVTLLRDESMEIDAGKCGPPAKLNPDDVGYYRVLYDPATQTALTRLIETMPPADRVNLLADNWAMVEAGRLAPPTYFQTVAAVSNDDKRAVWREVIAAFSRIDGLERGLDGRSAFQAYARSILRAAFERLGWDAAPNEPEDNAILRAALISTLGGMNDAAIIAEAKWRFAAFLKNPASLDVNLRDAVVGIAGRNADRQTYDALRKLGRDATSSRDRMRYYAALASASDPQLAEETLHIALTDELDPERSGELILIVGAGEHPELALQFTIANFEALAAKRSPEFRLFFVSSLMANFADRAHAEQLVKFAPVHETAGGRIEAARAEAHILEAADFREHQLRAIDDWIAAGRTAGR
ncbi:MAG: M1 family metallopeptidase [Candidatus Binataceae bacterium]